MDETEALRALTEADRWIDRVAAQRAHLPEMAELATLETVLRSESKALGEAKGRQIPVRAAYEEADRKSVV